MSKVKSTLVIMKWSSDIMDAKRQAQDEYDFHFPTLQPYIDRVIIRILRELRADQGLVGYGIYVFIEAEQETIDRFYGRKDYARLGSN